MTRVRTAAGVLSRCGSRKRTRTGSSKSVSSRLRRSRDLRPAAAAVLAGAQLHDVGAAGPVRATPSASYSNCSSSLRTRRRDPLTQPVALVGLWVQFLALGV